MSPNREPPASELLAEHARLAERARAADQRFRAVLDANSAGFCIIELLFDAEMRPVDYVFVEANAAFEKETGLGDVLGKRILELAPDHPPFWAETYGKVALDGEPAHFEAEGLGRWFEGSASRFGDAKRRQVAVVFADVSARKRAEQELADTRQRLDTTLIAAEVGTWTWQIPEDVVQGDRNMAALYALGAEEAARGTPLARFLDAVHVDDRERVCVDIQKAIADHAPFHSEYRVIDIAGVEHTVIARGTPTYDAAGTAVSFPGVVIDITRQKKAEAALQLTQTRLEQALAAGHLGTWELDMATQSMTCSRTCKTNYGRHADEPFTYQQLAEAIHVDDMARWQKVVGEAFAAGLPFEIEYRTRWPDQSVHWVMVRGTCTMDASGKPIGMTGVSLNVDSTKRIEEQLVAANQQKDEFLATASHELRTPLNAILGWARLLRSGQLDPAGYLRAVETIERNAKAQVQLIEDILDGSRIITGKLQLELRRVDLAALARAAVDTLRPASEAKQITVTLELDPRASALVGDADRLQQVVWNLLNNAIKFTPRGGAVTLRVARTEGFVDVVVSDDGQGIAPDFLPHVFQRFRQGDEGTTRRHAGLGLGLALVRHLVEAHGGTVRAESEGPGKGATFFVSLPVRAGVHESMAPPTSATLADPSRLAQSSLAGYSVLVVDDEPDARELVATVLRANGAQVTKVASVAEAIIALGKSTPSVLISDIGMPDADGYALIEHVRNQSDTVGAAVPAVALTAYAREEDRRRAIEAGFQTHVAKPFEPLELVRVVSGLLMSAPAR